MAETTLPSRDSHGAHPGPHSSEDGRGDMQDRLEAEAEARAREIQEAERIKVEEQREARDRHFWVDGVVDREPTQLAYLVAQALANITAYFHSDPDNPPTVNGFLAEIETVDGILIQARARKFADIQKAYLRAKTKRLIHHGKLEESGEVFIGTAAGAGTGA